MCFQNLQCEYMPKKNLQHGSAIHYNKEMKTLQESPAVESTRHTTRKPGRPRNAGLSRREARWGAKGATTKKK